jgi:hypothetical protein
MLDAAVDDQQLRNDVTVQRDQGSEARAVLETGPLSVDDVGTYDTQVTVNVVGDTFLPNQAGWRLHLGTVDDARFPQITVDLDRAPALADAAGDVRPGHLITMNNLPDTIAAGGVASLLAQGWTEDIGSHRRTITFNCTPASPYTITVAESTTGSTVNKADTAGSQLASGINTTATSLSVTTTIGPVWTDANAEDGFDIYIGGERMTVTDISGTSSPQTFTVTRSVNGIIKSHLAGAAVRLFTPPRLGL